MKSIDALKAKIQSFKIVAQTIADELAIMSEQLSQIELQKKNETESKNNSFLLERQTKNVATFFYDKGYIITDLKTQEPTDFPYKFAKQLWKRPELVFKYIPPIFRDLRDRNKPEQLYPIEELSKDDIAWLLNLCKSMKEQGYINYEHIESPPTLSVVQSSIPKDIRFFQGGWAEAVNRLLIYRTLSQYSKTKNLSYKVFWNVWLKKIDSQKNNKRDMELDIVVDLKDRFYIFETKSGTNLKILRWADRVRIFETNDSPKCRFITCCLDPSIDARIFKPCLLFVLQTLEKQFQQLLERDDVNVTT